MFYLEDRLGLYLYLGYAVACKRLPRHLGRFPRSSFQ
jgi:D-serine dehydratase